MHQAEVGCRYGAQERRVGKMVIKNTDRGHGDVIYSIRNMINKTVITLGTDGY